MIGVSTGLPKTAAVDENTSRETCSATIASSTDECPDDVVAVVAGRIAHRVADRQPRGEMHHGVHVVVPEGAAQPLGVVDVALDEGVGEPRRFAVAGREVVVDHDALAGLAQRLDGVAADVARPAGDENARHHARAGRPIDEYVKPCARICSGL